MEERGSSYKLALFIVTLFSFYLSNTCHALPFTIIPNGPLPTSVYTGSKIPASYIVINNTKSFRRQNFVKYLPPNVSIASGSCVDNFNLAPNGQAGDRCILNLFVSGPVNARDPDPHHHLFVCFPGGTACAGTQYPLNVRALPSNQNFTTVGFSYDLNSFTSALAYYSQDGGNHWLPSAALPVIANGQDFALSGVSCVANICTSVGAYFTLTNFFNLPLAYVSFNGGITWALSQALPLPADISDEILNSVSCTNEFCSAIGSYASFSSPGVLPIAYQSHDHGMTWILANTLPLPADYLDGAQVSVACTANRCASVGTYFSGASIQPFAYTSQNAGIDWTLFTAFSVPSGQINAELLGITCTSTHCTAVGSSQNNLSNDISPLVYTSNNGGVSWSPSPIITLPAGYTEADIHAVACLNNQCLAVGDANTLVGPVVPIVYRSGDDGIHWQSMILPIPNGFDGGLTSISCSGGICNAVGSTTNLSNDLVPLSYQTTDTGISWQVTSPALPPGVQGGSLTGVSGAQQSLHKQNALSTRLQKRHSRLLLAKPH